MAPYTYEHSKSNIDDLVAAISKDNIECSIDPSIRDPKSNTPHSPALSHETPLAVFFPKSTQETSIIVKACNERRIAVTSFSGGTSLGGALTALKGGVCVSFERMDGVVRLNEDDMDVVVQPGLGWVDLNEQLKDKGLFFPVDPAPGAKIGGMVRFSHSSSMSWCLSCYWGWC
jgi:D-lactate dehydrogenase (cytochrome)